MENNDWAMSDAELDEWLKNLGNGEEPEHLPNCQDGECDCAFELWFCRCMHCGALSNPCLCEEE